MSTSDQGGWKDEQSIRVIEGDDRTQVIAKGQVYMSWAAGDEGARRMAIVQLYENGMGTQEQLAEAFGVHVNSVQKYLTGFALEGSGCLVSQRRGPRSGWKLTPHVRSKILAIVFLEGVAEVKAIQSRLREGWHEDVSLPSIRQVLGENGLLHEGGLNWQSESDQGDLFDRDGDGQLDLDLDCDKDGDGWFLSDAAWGCAETEEPGVPVVAGSRLRARSGYSSAQRVYFDRLEQGDYNAYAGGLLFAPLLEQYEFLPTLKRVIDIPTYEGYSLDELCLTLLYADVFGFRSMEDFKRAYPEEFGVLIGRAQSPSVFTLRRFLHKVREQGKSETLIDEFAVSYLKHGLAQWGVMYIDGHFLPYHGIYPIKKGWHGVRQIPMKGSYNFLAVDEGFRPWLFLIRSSSEDLLQKIPELIEKAKKLGCAAGLSREAVEDLIVLFDREGYSAELYRYLEGKDEGDGTRRAIFISWAKYADKWVYDIEEAALDQTVKVFYAIRKPEEIRYVEMDRTMNKYGKIRAIVIQSGKQKKRAVIYTNASAEELGAERVVRLMCRRWGEENQIKELLLKHMINYMPGYVTEDLDEQPWVENPKVKELKKKRVVLKSDLRRFKVQLADDMLSQPEQPARPINAEGFPIMESIVRTENEILLLNGQLDELSAQVRFDEAHDGLKLMTLNYEKKRFLDCIKVFACNLNESMCRMLLKHYDRRKEILPALSMIVERAGEVKLEDGELRVRLRGFRNPEIDYAARRLCEDLNGMNPRTLDRFRLSLRYEVI
ncbi:MAG: helix-turn-helix domain-containing protein [Syntrophaceae bacterium]|nr:helix-turn-helix domain-containing protein [Syntrophaceae bacterium]